MSVSEEQIQAINIEDSHISRIEAEAEILQAINSTSSRIEPYEGTTENLYYIQIRTKGGEITATLYITDDPETDLTGLKEELESLVNERKNILRGSPDRDDLMRAITLQSRIVELGRTIRFKQQLLKLSNPALEGNNSKITASLI